MQSHDLVNFTPSVLDLLVAICFANDIDIIYYYEALGLIEQIQSL
jgi:hypothetical protein